MRYGRIRYEGALYVVVTDHREPVEDLEELCRRCVDHDGRSRYGTRGKTTWYGALDAATAIAEACYHTLIDGSGTEMHRARAMYQLRVRGRFVDLYGRELTQPGIIADDYTLTQAIARDARAAQLCGVLYPSARSNGTCLAIFERKALRSAKFVDSMPMCLCPDGTIDVRPPGSDGWHSFARDDLCRLSADGLELA